MGSQETWEVLLLPSFSYERKIQPMPKLRFDNNQYSVAARAVGRPVDVRAYADRIAIRQDGEIVAEHPRSFGRGQVAYDPWHYVPTLASSRRNWLGHHLWHEVRSAKSWSCCSLMRFSISPRAQ